jgi:hypothetical protein
MKFKHVVIIALIVSSALYGLYQFRFFSNGAFEAQNIVEELLTNEKKEVREKLYANSSAQFRSLVSKDDFFGIFENLKNTLGSFQSYRWKNHLSRMKWGSMAIVATAEADYLNATVIHKFTFIDSSKGTQLQGWDIQLTQTEGQIQTR